MLRRSRYYSWAVLDVEDWSGRPAVNAANIQDTLRRIETEALARAGIDPDSVARQPRGDGAMRAIAGEVAKERIATRFVEELRQAIADYDAGCPPGESIRVRLALHAGDVIEGEGEWAGRPVVVASRLVDSAVIKRVLAAATGSPLALIVSGDWYDAVVKEGYAPSEGYAQVWVEEKTFADVAWVAVPGRTHPPGLRAEDDPGAHGAARGRACPAGAPRRALPGEAGEYTDNSINYGNSVRDSVIRGDVVFGGKYDGDPGARGGES